MAVMPRPAYLSLIDWLSAVLANQIMFVLSRSRAFVRANEKAGISRYLELIVWVNL
jgi:hypothetical protein